MVPCKLKHTATPCVITQKKCILLVDLWTGYPQIHNARNQQHKDKMHEEIHHLQVLRVNGKIILKRTLSIVMRP